MNEHFAIKYFGWSSIGIYSNAHTLFFDPFYRRYCGAQWSDLNDYAEADVVCITHGHEEHFIDAPGIIQRSGASVVSSPQVCRFLRKRNKINADQLIAIDYFEPVEVSHFKITAFKWKHRDINLPRALTKALFNGNTAQLKWAWNSATQAPFYAPYVGYVVELEDGTTIMNYNEGFNTKMTEQEIQQLGKRFQVDILLAGMQLDFVDDVARGVSALSPETVILYPPHEKFHAMMGVASAPWPDFVKAAKDAVPQVKVFSAAPGWSFS